MTDKPRAGTPAERPAPAPAGAAPADAVQIDLRILGGVHAGAQVRLPERGILMVGRADDCDLIMRDPGVTEHHLVLTLVGDDILLRPLDGPVRVDGHERNANGKDASLAHFAVVEAGDGLSFAVGPHGSERWKKLIEQQAATPEKTAREHGGRRLAWVIGLLLAFAALVFVGGGWQLLHEPPASEVLTDGEQAQRADAVLAELGLTPQVWITSDDEEGWVLRGVVEHGDQLVLAREGLAALGLKPEVRVRSWPGVEQEMQTIFGMYGYDVRLAMDREDLGVVATGHFGGGDTNEIQSKVLGAREMQRLNNDIGGTMHVALVDLDAEVEPEVEEELDPDRQIRQLKWYRKSRAYVVTADESRYYQGDELEPWGTFLGADPESGAIIIRVPDGRIMELRRESKYSRLESPSTPPEEQEAEAAPAETDAPKGSRNARSSSDDGAGGA